MNANGPCKKRCRAALDSSSSGGDGDDPLLAQGPSDSHSDEAVLDGRLKPPKECTEFEAPAGEGFFMGLSTLTEDAKAEWAGAADACFPATNSKTPTHPRYAGLVEEMGRWEEKLGCLFTVNQVGGKRKYHKGFFYDGK